MYNYINMTDSSKPIPIPPPKLGIALPGISVAKKSIDEIDALIESATTLKQKLQDEAMNIIKKEDVKFTTETIPNLKPIIIPETPTIYKIYDNIIDISKDWKTPEKIDPELLIAHNINEYLVLYKYRQLEKLNKDMISKQLCDSIETNMNEAFNTRNDGKKKTDEKLATKKGFFKKNNK
jgi:hypothetical protein